MERLSLSFLGTFQVRRGEQVISKFRSVNVQGLLVYLAMQRERPFPRDLLATLFWPDESDRTARTNLRQSLYQLRKTIEEKSDPIPKLLINRQTVQFNPECDHAIDVVTFVDAISQGDWQTAVSLYKGDLLPGFISNSLDFEEWLRQQREHLHHLALDAYARQLEQLLQSDSNLLAITLAEQLLTLEPWHEPAHRYLMIALAQSGNVQRAMQQFEACKRVLWEELGVEPEEETAVLAQKIADNAPGTPLLTRDLPSHNLTTYLTPFFGREAEQAAIQRHLVKEKERLLTLLGEGGIGKSRLAVQVGWRLLDSFDDGVWFVGLAGITAVDDPHQTQEQIATTIAQAMHHTLGGQQEPISQLQAFLRPRHALLILDNFEHLLAGAELVVALLEQVPHLHVLCTSRERLNFLAERVIPMTPLPLPQQADPFEIETAVTPPLTSYPAVQLFVDRANRVNQFALTDQNEAQVTTLCHLLSGIPLALELAAASLGRRTLAQLLSDIQQSVDSLTSRRRDLAPRHRSMRAVFDASWGLLSNNEQATFALLSIFRGGFDAEAATAVTGASLTELQNLQDKSLLYVDEGRYRLHELLRQFLVEKLQTADLKPLQSFIDPMAFMQEQHSHYYLSFVAERGAGLNGPAAHIPADEMARELENIRLAWQTAVSQNQFQALLPALLSLSDFFQMRGFYREGKRLFGQAIAQFEQTITLPYSDDEAVTLAHLLVQHAAMHVRLSQYPAAEAMLDRSLPLAEQAADQWLACRLLITLSETHWRRGNLADAEEKLAQAMPIAEAIPDHQLRGIATFHLGVVHDLKGQHKRSLALLEEALAIFERLENGRWQGFALNSIGFVAQRLSKWKKAESALLRSLTINQQNRDLQNQISTLNNLSIIATEQSAFLKSKLYLKRALSLAQTTGDQLRQARTKYNLARNAKEANWDKEFHLYSHESLSMSRQIGNKAEEMKAMILLGEVNAEKGHIVQAEEFYQTALKLSQEVGDGYTQQEILQSLKNLVGQ